MEAGIQEAPSPADNNTGSGDDDVPQDVSRNQNKVKNNESRDATPLDDNQEVRDKEFLGQQPVHHDFHEVSLFDMPQDVHREAPLDTNGPIVNQQDTSTNETQHDMSIQNIIGTSSSPILSDSSQDEEIMYSIGSTPSENVTPSHKSRTPVQFSSETAAENLPSPQPSEQDQNLLKVMEEQNEVILRFKEMEEKYQKKLHEMESTQSQLETEVEKLKSDMKHQQEDFAKTISDVKTRLNSKVDQSVKQSESAKKDLESMVIKYAMSEKQIITAKRAKDLAEQKMREYQKENDSLASRVKSLTADKTSLTGALDRRILESAALHKEVDKLKDEIREKDQKLKQVLHKLRVEEEAHAEVKEQLLNLNNVVELLKQEIDITKTSSSPEDQMTDHLDEDSKDSKDQSESASGDNNLKGKSQVDNDTFHDTKKRLEELLEQNSRLKIDNKKLEKDRIDSEQLIVFLKKTIDSLKADVEGHQNKNSTLEKRISELESSFRTESESKNLLEKETERLKHSISEVMQEIEMYRQKEAELLEFTERSTLKSSNLQTEFNDLQKRLFETKEELEIVKHQLKNSLKEKAAAENQLKDLTECSQKQINDLMTENHELKSRLDKLKAQKDERENDQRVMAKKHHNLVKELNKELLTLRKKLETYESNNSSQLMAPAPDALSLHSRTSSSSSFDGTPSQYLGASAAASSHTSGDSNHLENGHISSSSGAAFNHNQQNSLSLLSCDHQNHVSEDLNQDFVNLCPELDKQRLVERVIKLQKNLAKRNEKIDFLEDHNQQLLEELKKKTRLIQYYMLREESGALSTSRMDQNKAMSKKERELAKKGSSIMSALFLNQGSADTQMTLELSLEINRKLQAVLEDTILKNITLKENLSTLGDEVARLSRSTSSSSR